MIHLAHCATHKKAPLAGEATGRFDYHKLYATDLKLSAAASLRTLTAAYVRIVAQWLNQVNSVYATFLILTTRLRSLNADSSGL